MKQTEKLKRIKLISEYIFSRNILPTADALFAEDHSVRCIRTAQIFVDEFEKFETEFLKEHEVEDGNDSN